MQPRVYVQTDNEKETNYFFQVPSNSFPEKERYWIADIESELLDSLQ